MRIHITGASGTGTTTLGAALAGELGCLHLDADDFYWYRTVPPFTKKREPEERVALLHSSIGVCTQYVLSGSIGSWGKTLEDVFDLIVFLYLPVEIRLKRLRERETDKYGFADPKFLEWASQYDEGPSEGRSLAKHNAWLSRRKCPVLRLETDLTVNERVVQVRSAISKLGRASAA